MIKNLDNLPQEVVFWLSSRGRKSSTTRNINQTLKRLIAQDLSPSTPQKFKEFIYKLKQDGYSTSHINNYISAMRVWCHYNDAHNIKNDIKLSSLKFVPDKYKIKATMSDDEIEAFLSLPVKSWYRVHPKTKKRFLVKGNEEGHTQWTVFFSLMAYTGMRPGEVANLNVNDIDFGREVVVLHDTKINRPRLVPLPPNISQLLKDYVSTKNKRLFTSSRSSGVVTSVEWGYQFHERIKRLGIKRTNLTPYSLRHSLITRLLEEDVNIFKVQKIVGHTDLRTTAVYTHLTTKDTQRAIQKHPLIKKHTDPHNILNSLSEYVDSLELLKDDRFDVSKTLKNNKLILEIDIK